MTSDSESNSSKKSSLFFPVLLTAFAFAFTLVVKFVDVRPVGPEGSSVGLAALNSAFQSAFGFNEFFYHATEFLGVLPFLTILVFGGLGLAELLRRKSLRKIDRELFYLVGFYLAMFLIYFLFEKLAINFRPILLEGVLEPSYPSSHTFFAMSLSGSAILLLPRFFDKKSEPLVKVFCCVLAVLALTIVFGRLFSGVHWLSDILGGLLFSAALVSWLGYFTSGKN